MSEKSIHVSTKSLVWSLVIIISIVLIIILLNSIDNRKKYRQFKSLNENILKSEFPDRFGSMIKGFSVGDTSLAKRIKQNLGLLLEDMPEINYSEIYIRGNNCYYKITNEQYYNNEDAVSEIKFLPHDIQRNITYLDNHAQPEIDSLYLFEKENPVIELMFKVGNAYLKIRQNRN